MVGGKTLTPSKCINTAYGAKPTRSTNKLINKIIMKEPVLPLLDSSILNTKAGFKLIYNTMLATNDFSKAMKCILKTRQVNIITIENILVFIKARYKKEKHDYIHALFNNNINN